MNFSLFKAAVAKQFERMAQHQLFCTGITKDAMWDLYLASFPEGTNPIYKTRREYDCNCCKQFVRAVGDVVALIDGKLESIWDITVAEHAFQVVAAEMSNAVKNQPITDAFLHYEKTAGTNKNLQDTLDGVKTWEHFFVNIPARFVMPGKDIATKLNDHRTARDVLARGLAEIKLDDLDAVLELIAQNSLYRGEEHKFAVTEFKKVLKQGLSPAGIWNAAMTLPASVSRFRNTSIGTLLVDLSEGKDLEDAVKSFEAKVAPTNYKRPTALVTKAMIEKAKATIESMGLTSALTRRYAKIDDIAITNVLFADRSAKKAMGGNVFDDLVATAPVSTLSKVEEVSIDKFLADILPKATSLEVMVENSHTGNLVSLVAPDDATALPLFKWGNKFSWSYNGDVADSIKERVKAAGGNVTGVLCCRLAWEYRDDLDFHMYEPSGYEIYFGNRFTPSPCNGRLDVDANGGSGMMAHPVENIFYPDKHRLAAGVYRLEVENFSRRDPSAKGFEVEIEFDGVVHSIAYDKSLRTGETVTVAEIIVDKTGAISLSKSLPTSKTVKIVWGVATNTFQPVSAVMLSPNHWDGEGVGNRHFFFMLKNCVNEGQARGFYNEFLKADLNEHRKVIEMVGAKLKTETASEQLSGLGFSSTQRNHVLCKVSGAFSRIVKVNF